MTEGQPPVPDEEPVAADRARPEQDGLVWGSGSGVALAGAIGNRALARLSGGNPNPQTGTGRRRGLSPASELIRVLARDANAPPPPDRDTLVSNAISQVLTSYENLTVQIPAVKPPAPGAPQQAAPAPTDAGAPAPPTPLSFASPYYINRSSGDTGAAGGQHALGAPGVRAWFDALPGDVRVGKGTPDALQAAMQQAVDQGLLNATWPPTSQNLRDFMGRVGLGVDCSGFVYQALMAANVSLTGTGLTGLTTPQTTNAANTSSQEIGRSGGARVTSPGDLRVGDVVQLAPNASHAVGHVRIVTAVRAGADFVEYDTAESTTRVGSGPQSSTWRVPTAGPMDTAHLQVNLDGTWRPEPSGRESSYWRRLAVPAPATPAPATAPVSPSTGPASVARVLARAEPRADGWNVADRTVGATWRFPITGLTQGLDTDDANPATAESAKHRAVAIVPTSVSAQNLEVLVHFHGNNLGERERVSASESGMAKGTVRDVEGDLIPQQIAASGRNLIAILPQGTVAGGSLKTKFGITDLRGYVTDVLTQVVTHVNNEDGTKNLTSLTPVRIEISGHSGGGPSAVGAATAMQPSAGVIDDQWVAAPPLLLFDAINGIEELKTVTALVRGWLDDDFRRLLSHSEADAATLLGRRGLKFRSTYTSGVYHATNAKDEPRTYQYPPHPPVTVPANLSLEAQLDDWFAHHNAELASNATTLRQQYVVKHWTGTHDFTVGAGSLQTGSRTTVADVTAAPGAPATSTQAPDQAQGNLADALSQLSPIDRVVPPAATGTVARSRRTTLARQGPPPPARQPPGSSGTHDGTRYVVYQDEVRSGGTKAWRNNNPGNIVGGAWANQHGAIGTAFRMAVFPDEATGAAAIPALLHTARFQAMTIREAISTYAPPSENDTESYIRSVTRGAGVPDTTLLSALTEDQIGLIVGVIRRVEGWAEGTTYYRTGPDWVRALLGPAPAPPPPPPTTPPVTGTPPPAHTDAGDTIDPGDSRLADLTPSTDGAPAMLLLQRAVLARATYPAGKERDSGYWGTPGHGLLAADLGEKIAADLLSDPQYYAAAPEILNGYWIVDMVAAVRTIQAKGKLDALASVCSSTGAWFRVGLAVDVVRDPEHFDPTPALGKLSDQDYAGFTGKTRQGQQVTDASGKPVGSQVDELKTAAADLKELKFITDPNTSSLDLLSPELTRRYRTETPWAHEDYPGGVTGPNEARAVQMATDLSAIRPERRANSGPSRVVGQDDLQQRRMPEYISRQLVEVPGLAGYQLNSHAAAAYAEMRAAAAKDGVALDPAGGAGSGVFYRTPEQSASSSAASGNRNAVAKFSSHNLGLAVDLKMSYPGHPLAETTTRPMRNVIDMRSSPAHKWVFLRGARWGFYPYQNEPWHWEYNPDGFRDTFMGEYRAWLATQPAGSHR
jgi:hypothetical protein